MYDIKTDFPSNKDLKLLSKLDDKGKYLLEDLQKIFSYRKPKAYKLFVERINYIPKEEEKEIMDLILIIQKYNEILKKKMEKYNQKREENKYFSFLYKGIKYFSSDLASKDSNAFMNLIGNLINKYEQRHINLDSKFLNRNIFNQSGLLPFTQKQTSNFFESEIQKNGQNSPKSIKTIHFIEKLYEQIEKISKRITFSSSRMTIEDERKQNRKKRAEYLEKLNNYKIQKKEINDNLEEIKNIKELINIANINYQKIIRESSNSNKKHKIKFNIKNKRKFNSKSVNIKDKMENKIENSNKSNENCKIENNKNTDKDNMIKLFYKNENNMKNNLNKLKNFRNSERYNQTLSSEAFNKLNLLNNRMTASTGFMDFKNISSKQNTFYNPNKIMNKMNSETLRKKKFFPTYYFQSNSIDNNKTFIKLDNEINIIHNMNKTSFDIMGNKGKSDKKFCQNIESKTINNNNILLPKMNSKEKNDITNNKRKMYKKKSNIKKKNFSQKNEKKPDKIELYLIRRKKIPLIYEELKSYKNLLRIAKRNNSQSMRIENLFSQLYDKKKIKFFNGQKAPKELYNSYYNMKESIERCQAPEKIFKKYKSNMGESLRKKIGKSNDQDEELKSKYYDFMQMIIKKKIEDEND